MTTDGWMPLEAGDIETVAAIASCVHPALPERTAVLAEKNRLFPAGCRKLLVGGRMLGYGLAHPWTIADPPALDAYLRVLPPLPDCLFIHDVAVLPQARGQGAAAAFLVHVESVAKDRRLPALALVAAYGTARLWARFGFAAIGGETLAAKLAAYGPEARYLGRPVR